MDFSRPWEYSDIVFLVEGRKLYANKAVLGMASDVFRTMFTADFSERALQEIPLPYKRFDDVLELMQVLHPSYNKPINETNVQCILPLAHEYQLQHVHAHCVKALSDAPPSVLNLNLADKYSLPQLYQRCLTYTTQTPLKQLRAEPGFDELSERTIVQVLNGQVEQLSERNKVLVRENEHLVGVNRRLSELQVKIAKVSNGEIISPSYQMCPKDDGIDRHSLGTDRRCMRCSHYNIDKIYRIVQH